MKQISKIEKRDCIYKGELRNGQWYENYKFSYGQKIESVDAWVNAKNILNAVNKLARKLGINTYNDLEELNYDLEDGYVIAEESNYYDEEENETYKYYVSFVY